MDLYNDVFISVILVLICLITSCGGQPETTGTPVPTVIEPGLAYGTPCKPPCWRGLVPGQATHQDVVQAMERLRTEGWANRIDGGATGYYIYPLPSLDGYIYVAINGDGTVTEIEGKTAFYYSVESLVNQFGDPEGLFLVDRGSTICPSCEKWEPPDPLNAPMTSSPARLLYPTQGLRFSILIPLSGLGCICPEMKVIGFNYYIPVSMQELLEDMNQEQAELYPHAGLPDITTEDLIEWHGFGGGY